MGSQVPIVDIVCHLHITLQPSPHVMTTVSVLVADASAFQLLQFHPRDRGRPSSSLHARPWCEALAALEAGPPLGLLTFQVQSCCKFSLSLGAPVVTVPSAAEHLGRSRKHEK